MNQKILLLALLIQPFQLAYSNDKIPNMTLIRMHHNPANKQPAQIPNHNKMYH